MAGNADNLVQAQRVVMWLAPLATALPTGVGAPTGFRDVGFSNPESVRFRVSPEFERIWAHQTDFPVKIFQKSSAAGIDIDLMEWSGDNFVSVYGGGEVTEPTTGVFKFVPPAFGERQEVEALLDVIDGAYTYRFVAPRVFNESEVELTLNKTPESRLPLRLTILGDDGVDAWYLITNDPAFDPA